MVARSSSTRSHRKKAEEAIGPLHVSVITVSDSRDEESDKSGRYLKQALAKDEHVLEDYRIIKDEPEEVRQAIDELLEGPSQVVLLNGGTGISPRDNTYDVVAGMLDKTLPGFGELFRMLSFEQVGAAAMLSRAVAGVAKGKLVISTPGSTNAVRLAWTKLLKPEISHLVWELTR